MGAWNTTQKETGHMPTPADREKALETALAQIDRQFGKGSVMRLGSDERAPVAVIPTGSIALDVALGIGGLPRGRIVEIYGPESSGKTTLTLQVVTEIQKLGGTAAFVDAEHALEPSYAEKLDVNVNDLLVSQPVRKLTGNISRSNTMVIFINQIRMKIGVMFGNPETTTGGNALKFYSSVRLDIRRIQALKDGENVIGNRTRVKVVKNKMAPPFKEVEFDILYGEGISKEGDLLDLAATHNVVEK